MTGCVILTAIGIGSAENLPVPDNAQSAPGTATQGPAQQFEGFNLQGYTDDGKKAWDVQGDTADVLNSSIQIHNVDANGYGEQRMNVKAKTGTVDKASGNLHLEKNVVITTDRGTQLKTDALDWQRSKDLVTTEDKVVITDESLTAVGKGATAHPNLKQAQLNEDVTVKLKTKSKNPGSQVVTITSDGPMVIDQAKQTAIFHDNVVAIQEGRILKADKMEVFFNVKTNKITKIICTGNVSITQGENRSYSKMAIYDTTTQSLTLAGQPKLILMTEGENPLTALGSEPESNQ